MTRRIDFRDWLRVRATIGATQTEILVRERGPAEPRAEGRPLHSHRPRSDEEWNAIADGVRALLAERVSSGRWKWVERRRVVIGREGAGTSERRRPI
jgi:hypothetical protein